MGRKRRLSFLSSESQCWNFVTANLQKNIPYGISILVLDRRNGNCYFVVNYWNVDVSGKVGLAFGAGLLEKFGDHHYDGSLFRPHHFPHVVHSISHWTLGSDEALFFAAVPLE